MSRANIDNIEKKLHEIRLRLPDYLLEHGQDITNGRKIKCLNPEHDDNNPSMSSFDTAAGTPAIHCFSCGWSADIFMAAHVLENKPIVGPGFLQDNVRHLGDKFGVDVPLRSLTEEEIYEMQTYQAYNMAAKYIAHCNFEPHHLEELQRRGWGEKFVRDAQIGCCDNFTSFRNQMKSYGFSARFLDEIDLGNEKIFSPENLIFTVHDENGRPVGFAARNLNFDGVRDDNGHFIKGSKFNNTRTTNVKCNIYKKSERLYLLHRAKRKSPPLYIFEGYGDALTAQQAGLGNSCAIGALELSEHHLNTCRRNGCYDVVICLDSDDAGMGKARRLLDEVLQNVHDIRIRFIFLTDGDNDKVDPDMFIRDHGIEAFINLPKVEPFVWRLQEFERDGDADAESICFSMIPIVMMEPSAIKRERMIRELSAHTGYSEKVIREELEKLKETDDAKVQKSKDAIIDSLVTSLKSKKDSPNILLQRAQDDLYKVEKEHSAGDLEIDNIVNDMLSIKQYTENREMHTGINIGPHFSTLAVALAGDLRGKFVIGGGTGNTGKTSMFCNLMLYLAENNDDIISVMFTIDDSSTEFIPRMVALDMAKRTYETNKDLFDLIEINKVSQPFLFEENVEYQAMEEERQQSWRNIINLGGKHKIIIKDSENGKSVDYINTTLKDITSRYPDKRVIAFIDNFHLVDVPGYEDGRIKYKNLSHDLKHMCTKYGCTIFATAEYTKIAPGVKPTNNNLSETVALEYDANVIFHLYSELHSIREQSNKYFWGAQGQQYGIIEQDFGKNKVNSFKGTIYYKFYADKAFYTEISRQEAEDIENANAQTRSDQLKAKNGYMTDEPLNTFGAGE